MKKVYLTQKYRLIWNSGNLYIQNNYEKDYSGSLTTLITKEQIDGEPTYDLERFDYFESDIYSDIINKIAELGLTPDPGEPLFN